MNLSSNSSSTEWCSAHFLGGRLHTQNDQVVLEGYGEQLLWDERITRFK